MPSKTKNDRQMNLKHIIEGWLKRFKIIKSDKALSEYRLTICKTCPKAKASKLLVLINGDGQYVDSLQCTECGCPCLEKSLVTGEKCPLGKW